MEMRLVILTCLPSALARMLRAAGLGLALAATAACTPQSALLMNVLPAGTVPVLLSHLQGVDDSNRRRIAELESRGDWQGLAQLAEENLARDRNNADWWLVAGYAYSQLGQHPRAAQCFGEMVRLAPDDMLGWNLLAQSYRSAGEAARAVQTLNSAVLVRKDVPATWFLLGESYSDLGRFDPAAAAYREALQLNGNFAQAWFGLGRAYARLGRADEFEKAAQALQRLNPALAKELAGLRPGPR